MRLTTIRIVLICLFTACVGVWSYNAGTLSGSVEDGRLKGLHEVECDDIVGMRNSYTGKMDLVCEIKMQEEDDNLHIWKGPGTKDEL